MSSCRFYRKFFMKLWKNIIIFIAILILRNYERSFLLKKYDKTFFDFPPQEDRHCLLVKIITGIPSAQSEKFQTRITNPLSTFHSQKLEQARRTLDPNRQRTNSFERSSMEAGHYTNHTRLSAGGKNEPRNKEQSGERNR